jgi:hypothetical protein
MTIDHLFVIWGAPTTGARHVVGHLTRARTVEQPFRFWYEPDLSKPSAHGFRPLAVFPEHKTEAAPYRARHLFTTFADRIPSPSRADTHAMLSSWGVQAVDDQFEILARSGGLRATDRIELAEYRSIDDPLIEPLEFRMAGAKYILDGERARLTAGEALRLEREPTNASDQCATLVVARTGLRAGYVPRQYSGLVARLLEERVELSAVAVRELTIPEDAGRWVIRVERKS